jgi:hypothetical protein
MRTDPYPHFPGRMPHASLQEQPSPDRGAASKPKKITPGIIAVIQSFGSKINLHSHLHLLLTEGGKDPETDYALAILRGLLARGVLPAFLSLLPDHILLEHSARISLRFRNILITGEPYRKKPRVFHARFHFWTYCYCKGKG